MYHKTDHRLNQQIKDLSRIKVDVSFKRLVAIFIVYLGLLPVAVYLAITTRYDFILYLYLLPFVPIIFITYVTFTGKIKWLIRILHRLQKFFSPDR